VRERPAALRLPGRRCATGAGQHPVADAVPDRFADTLTYAQGNAEVDAEAHSQADAGSRQGQPDAEAGSSSYQRTCGADVP
jgi:hypothetical protein